MLSLAKVLYFPHMLALECGSTKLLVYLFRIIVWFGQFQIAALVFLDFSASTFILAVYFYRWSDEWPLGEQPAIATIEGAVNHLNLFPYLYLFNYTCYAYVELLLARRLGRMKRALQFRVHRVVELPSKVSVTFIVVTCVLVTGGWQWVNASEPDNSRLFFGSICGAQWRKP